MQTTESEIAFTLLATVLLVVGLGTFIVIFVFLYQKRRHQFQRDIVTLKENYEKEIVQTQLEIQDQTMQNIAREIHDNIGQILSLAKLNLNAINTTKIEEASNKITTTKNLVGKAIQDLRGLSKLLNSDIIADISLVESIRTALSQVPEMEHLQVSFIQNGEAYRLDQKVKIIIFRIFQELFNNAIKHAQAQLIDVQITYTQDNLVIAVIDNGKGLGDQPLVGNGSGIKNMEYRAGLIGATLHWQNNEERGATFTLTYPYENDKIYAYE
ncbi:MAG: sensor histidine kinase [Thermonemataceae bacterium]